MWTFRGSEKSDQKEDSILERENRIRSSEIGESKIVYKVL
jgi:hypothetical protein